MTTAPSEPVDNDQSGSDDHETDQGISADQLPEDLQPGPDNPLATPDGDVSEAPKPNDDDGAVPEGDQPPGNPSIG